MGARGPDFAQHHVNGAKRQRHKKGQRRSHDPGGNRVPAPQGQHGEHRQCQHGGGVLQRSVQARGALGVVAFTTRQHGPHHNRRDNDRDSRDPSDPAGVHAAQPLHGDQHENRDKAPDRQGIGQPGPTGGESVEQERPDPDYRRHHDQQQICAIALAALARLMIGPKRRQGKRHIRQRVQGFRPKGRRSPFAIDIDGGPPIHAQTSSMRIATGSPTSTPVAAKRPSAWPISARVVLWVTISTGAD